MADTTPPASMAQAVTLLLATGPLPLAEVVRHLAATGMVDELRADGVDESDLGEAVWDELIDNDDFWRTASDTLVLSSYLTDGRVFTHRLTDAEREAGEVAICPDLLSLDWDDGPGLELAGGARLTVELGPSMPGEDDSVLVGPDGWLDGFAPGDLLAFTRHGRSVHVSAVAAAAAVAAVAAVDAGSAGGDGSLEVGLLRQAVDGHIPPGHGDEALPLALDALAADPDAFRHPRPPLGELLEAAGLARRGFSFGRAGEAWTTRAERYQRDQRARLGADWGFGSCCQAAFDRVDSAYDRYRGDPDTALDAIARELGHSSVAPAFAGYTLDVRNDDAEQLSAFADAVLATAPAHQAAPPRYLSAAVAEHGGELRTAETMLRSVVTDHPGYGPAAGALARYEIDRSDIRRAITLLRHPDLDDDNPTLDFLEELRDRIDAPYRSVGRNQPCPCGSGRKFKQCCQRDRRPSLADRTPLVTHKLVRFAASAHYRSLLVGLASSASDPDDPDLISTLADLARDPIIVDFALWEGGAADGFLEERGELLPDDEADLIGRLADEPRRLWEVVGVDPGSTLTLRDTATGDQVVVDEHQGSLEEDLGELLLARVAAVEDGHQLFGAVVDVPLRLRQSALQLVDSAPDADALALWYGDAIAFPRLQNREGEPMWLCRAELASAALPSEISTALGAVLEDSGDGTWAEVWDAPGEERIIRGTVRLAGGRIHVEANSEARFERLLATVTGAVPDGRVVDEERLDPRQAMHRDGAGELEAPASPPSAEMSAEMEAVLDQLMRQKELAWLDESVPALAGLTPRQAVDDPTRREDLIGLLRQMEGRGVPAGGRGFDPGRLRGLLGL